MAKMKSKKNDAGLPEEVLNSFNRIMQAEGRKLYRDLHMLAKCQVSSPRLMRFLAPEYSGGKWICDSTQSARPSFGFNSVNAVKTELKALAGAGKRKAIAAYLVPSPVDLDMGFTLFSIFGDSEGNFAIGVQLDIGCQWKSIESAPSVHIIELLMEQDVGIGVKFFDRAAQRLVKDLASSAGEAPLSGPAQEKFLAAWLKREMREVGSLETRATGTMLDSFMEASEKMHEVMLLDVIEKATNQEIQHAKQVQKLHARIETAEKLAQGSQARANRLEAEAKELRQAGQANSASHQTDLRDQSIGQALDRLFA